MSEADESDYSKAGRRLGDLTDLPEALRSQLNNDLDDVEEKVIHTLRHRYNGYGSIDEVMVGLFREFGYVVEDRKVLANKIFRMTRAGFLERVPKRKGIVRIRES